MLGKGDEDVPEIRAQLTDEVHRKLKAEAAHRGMPLKELVAKILQQYVNSQSGKEKPKRR